MARRRTRTVSIPTTFVGTFYDVQAGVYVATRRDGSLTVGAINKRGVNVQAADLVIGSDPAVYTEH